MDLTYESINKEQARLEEYRKDFEPLKRICCDMAYPERVSAWDFQSAATGEGVKGKKIQSRIKRLYDPTAMKAFGIWSSGIIGHYMPKNINWFSEELGDRRLKDSKPIIKWLQETDEHLRYVLRSSGGFASGNNYYTQKAVAIKDGGCIGDSFMYIERDRETNKLFMQTCHPNEFWLKRDYWGRIVAIHHKTVTTMRNLVDEYGMKALNQDQQLKYRAPDSDKDASITLIHGVYKNTDFQPDKPGVKNMRWQHVYINVEGKHKILQTGSRKMNPVVWSLNRPSSEMYGRGVIGSMLIEILTSNFIAKDMLTASSVAVRPPMLMTQALRHKLDMGAGAVNFINNKEMMGVKMGDLVARLIDSSGYPFGVEQHQYWQSIIEDRLGVSLFLSLNMASAQGYKNVDHIETAKAERAVLMAPFLGTLDSVTDMDLDRVYDLELDAGNAPPIPEEVANSTDGRVDINYIGPLNQILKQYYEVGSLMTTINNMLAVMQIDPDAALVVKGDELMRRILRGGNSPEDIINSPQEVMEIKAIMAQQAEDARQMELMAKGASAVPSLGAKIDKDSLLGKVA
uniref:Putative head tail connector protein n=1 Tax=viral metagenome TaxID=1070528 RepID=A0A6M3KC95_9ZZZZ